MDAAKTRELIEGACRAVGFAPPAPDRGLAAWADESLDVALAPRGGRVWQRAQAYVIDAFEAALAGNEVVVRTCLARAVEIVRAEGRRECACPTPALPTDDGYGRARCARCLGRVNRKGDEPARSRT